MTNAAIIREHKQLVRYKRKLAVIKRQLQQLEKAGQQLDEKIQVLRRVTEIHDGVALDAEFGKSCYGREYKVSAVAYDIRRRAEVYTNAHTCKDYGLKLWDFIGPGPNKEHWCGTGWRFDDAVAIARRWVTRGNQPPESEMEMYRALGKLDPKGRLTAQRQLAFEAAWIAKHRELAEQIVRDRSRP
jgi:hypothetical protein